MGRFGFHSVFSRLFVSVFLALVVFTVCLFLLAQVVNNNSTTNRNRAIAKQIATQIEPFISDFEKNAKSNNRVQTRFSLVVIKKSFDIFDDTLNVKIGLYSPKKELLVSTNDSELPKRLHKINSSFSEILPTLSGNPNPFIQVKMSSGYILWYESRNPIKTSRFLGFFNFFTGTVLLLVIMSFVLWWIARSMTWRINEMSEQIKRMGDGDFSVRVSEQGNDEIAMLAYGFNQSAQKIEQLISANSLLLAHASHEFRTPITRIRLQTEMLEMIADRVPKNDGDMIKKRVKTINRDLAGLNELMESILLVSRLDAGQVATQFETINLYDLVAQECQHYPESLLYGEPIFIPTQPNLITHLVRNLINNALIHGKPPVSICIYGCQNGDDAVNIPEHLTSAIANQTGVATYFDELEYNKTDKSEPDTDNDKKTPNRLFDRFNKKGQKSKPTPLNYAVIAVIDEGSGIPADKREDIFSPFVRLKQEKKGSGLGLSLVAQIVETHGGSILTDTWQGKTRFLVMLPTKRKLITQTTKLG